MTLEETTFGCRSNAYESEVIQKKASENGLTNAFIINSCAGTSEAERQLRQEIRQLRKNHPDKKVILTGCAAQVNPEKYTNMVDIVMRGVEKMKDETYAAINNQEKLSLVSDIMDDKTTHTAIVEKFDGKVRGYLQVQTGCNHRCTFCIIPYGRGNSRSTPFREVLRQAKSLVENGYKELVITGVDITDYGFDLPGRPLLGQLVKRLLEFLQNLPRIRLSSIDVAEADKDLIDLIVNESRFMPYLHLRLQAGDNTILKRLKRRHTREQVMDFCRRVLELRPNTAFGADIIAGFPTATEEMFENTYNLLSEIEKIVHLHIFPYSEREGTPAARIQQVEKTVRKERAKKLRELGEKLLHNHSNSKIGQKIKVLAKSDTVRLCEDFCTVNIEKKQLEIGSITEQLVVSVMNHKTCIK